MAQRQPAKQPSWSRPLAELVSGVMDPVLARQGFGESSIILHWDEIVGERMARTCEPLKLQWPPRGPKSAPDVRSEPATLIIRVEGAFALELQHLAPVVIERVNAHLGWRCIGKLAMRQGPVAGKSQHPRFNPAFDAVAYQAAAAQAVGIEDGQLRDAVTRLGARVLNAGSKKP